MNKIFKTYDIRGKVPADLNQKKAQKIGLAIEKFLQKQGLKQPKIVLGYDNRKTSKSLCYALKKGLKQAQIKDIGLSSTPMLYFSCAHFKFDAGIMITASHLPGEFNGFKIVLSGARPLSVKQMLELKNIYQGLSLITNY